MMISVPLGVLTTARLCELGLMAIASEVGDAGGRAMLPAGRRPLGSTNWIPLPVRMATRQHGWRDRRRRRGRPPRFRGWEDGGGLAEFEAEDLDLFAGGGCRRRRGRPLEDDEGGRAGDSTRPTLPLWEGGVEGPVLEGDEAFVGDFFETAN